MNNEQNDSLFFARFLATHRPVAAAILTGSPAYPDVTGKVLFYPLNDRYTIVTSRFAGLPVEEGECRSRFFALHIHGGGSCTGDAQDPFRDAATHYNPDDCPHPAHAGDLPPILGTAKGQAWSAVLSDRFTVGEVLGKTIILHRQPDDFYTQPSGNAGEKMACGVIGKLYR